MKKSGAVKKPTRRLPVAAKAAVLRHDVRPTWFVLVVTVRTQRMALFERSEVPAGKSQFPAYEFVCEHVVSTSRFGTGQVMDSNRTPLGLHRIARKIGGGQPVGTIFKARRPVGFVGDGKTKADIVHRILWLDGLEPGFNRGGDVDTFRRYVYIHGFGDETTLGRPQSHGCVHLAAADLIPLYRRLPVGTLVWIRAR